MRTISALQRPPTPTQIERGADLGTLYDEAMIGMIIGERERAQNDANAAGSSVMGSGGGEGGAGAEARPTPV